MDQLIPGADKDLVTPLTKRIAKNYEAIWLGTKVTAVTAGPDGLTVTFDSSGIQGQGQGPGRPPSTRCWSPSAAAPTAR